MLALFAAGSTAALLQGVHVPATGCAAHRCPSAVMATAEQLEALHSWLEAEGVLQEDSPVRGSIEEGFGSCLSAGAAGTKPGDKLLAIPRRLHLTPSGARASAVGELLAGQPILDDDEAMLALQLLYELGRGEASPWAKYVAALPGADELDVPILWDDVELELLKGSHLPGAVVQTRTMLSAQWEALAPVLATRPELFPPDTFCAPGYLWAHATVLSRGLPFGDQISLIPLLDLANHVAGAPNACSIGMVKGEGDVVEVSEQWQLEQLGGEPTAVLTAGEAHSPAQQVFIDYGEAGWRSSWEMLFTYGFVPGESAEDWLASGGRPVCFAGVNSTDALYPQKRALMVALGCEEDAVDAMWLDVTSDAKQSAQMAPLLRLAHLSADNAPELAATLSEWRAEPQPFWESLQRPVAPQNEAAVAEQVVAACRAALEPLPPVDEVAVKIKEGGARERLAAKVLLGERNALETAIAVWSAALGVSEKKVIAAEA